jgi:hypothetical protein
VAFSVESKPSFAMMDLPRHIVVFQEWFMTKWQLQEAKARFSELIDDTLY